MSSLIKIKRSAVQGKSPNTSLIELGELALNTYDGKLFFKKDDGAEAIVTIQEVTENNLLVDTSTINNSTATNLSGVIADFDSVLTAATGGELSVFTDATINGNGTSGNPLSVANGGHTHTSSNITDFNASVNSLIGTTVNKTYVDGLNVNADTLDGFHGSYFLDYTNATNKPTIGEATVTFTGDSVIIPTGSFSVNDTTNTSIALAVNTAAISITESQISDLQAYLTSETVTALSIVGNTLTFTDETGANTNIDLSLYLDDTNLSRLTSGSVDANGLATFVRDDASTFTVDFSSLFDDTNLARITSAAFNTTDGVLTLTRDDASSVTVDLDGKYLNISDFTATANTWLATRSTSDLSEGTNLYYTTARANSAIDARVSKAYVDALNIDADTLDGANGSHYLDYNNFVNTPTIGDATISFTGDSVIIPSGSFSLNDTTNGSISLAVNTAAISITESQISDLQAYLTSETTTSLSLATNILTYTDETGANTDIDLSLYLDDTNLARLVNGSVDANGLATFERDDATSFTVDFSSLFDDTNLSRITSASFNNTNGDLTLTRDDATTVSVNLDGRYLTSETDSQTLTWTSANTTLSISNGNDVNLSSLLDDTNTTYDLVSPGSGVLRLSDNSNANDDITFVGSGGTTVSSNATHITIGSTDVTLAGSYDYLTIAGQQITLNQVDYNTDISNAPYIPTSGTDFDPVGTDNSTDVTLAGAYDYLTIAGQQITLNQIDYATDISNTPTIGDANITFTGDSVIIPSGSFSLNDTVDASITLAVNTAAISITESQISDLQAYLTSETTTSLSLATNILTYTDETGANTDIDLSLYLDDTNLARLVSGSIDANGLATFERDDASSFTVDFSSLFDDTNLARITSAAFNTTDGVLTLTRDDATDITVDLDGKYLDISDFATTADIWLQTRSTSNLSEGTNLYYTEDRANSAIDARVTKSFVDALNVDADTLDGANGSFYLDYGNFTNTPYIPTSGTDFDPVGTDNSTDVTLAGSYDYLTIVGQTITLNQVDYTTDISNTPTIGDATVSFTGDSVIEVSGSFSVNDTANSTVALTVNTAAISVTESQISDFGDYVPTSLIGANSGIAQLDTNGKVPTFQLPSYVDDVLEYANLAAFPATGESGKIYIDLAENDVYRWTGSTYIIISDAVSSADQATKLATARTIALTGDVTGSATFDGSANATITATVGDDSHNHTVSTITDFAQGIDNHLGATYVDNSVLIYSDAVGGFDWVTTVASANNSTNLNGQAASYYLDYTNFTNTPTIPSSGVDFDPVGTDNSTDVTLSGTYDYLTIAGQTITLNQIDYTTDISNTPTIPSSGVDFDPVGTDNSTDVTLAGSYDYLTISGQQITLNQIDYATDIANAPTNVSSFTNDAGYITGYTETDTLDNVTGRGSSTANDIQVGAVTVANTHLLDTGIATANTQSTPVEYRTYDPAVVLGGKLIIHSLDNSNGATTIKEVLFTHNNTGVYLTEYASVSTWITGSPVTDTNIRDFTVTATISGGLIRISITPVVPTQATYDFDYRVIESLILA